MKPTFTPTNNTQIHEECTRFIHNIERALHTPLESIEPKHVAASKLLSNHQLDYLRRIDLRKASEHNPYLTEIGQKLRVFLGEQDVFEDLERIQQSAMDLLSKRNVDQTHPDPHACKTDKDIFSDASRVIKDIPTKYLAFLGATEFKVHTVYKHKANLCDITFKDIRDKIDSTAKHLEKAGEILNYYSGAGSNFLIAVIRGNVIPEISSRCIS